MLKVKVWVKNSLNICRQNLEKTLYITKSFRKCFKKSQSRSIIGLVKFIDKYSGRSENSMCLLVYRWQKKRWLNRRTSNIYNIQDMKIYLDHFGVMEDQMLGNLKQTLIKTDIGNVTTINTKKLERNLQTH